MGMGGVVVGLRVCMVMDCGAAWVVVVVTLISLDVTVVGLTCLCVKFVTLFGVRVDSGGCGRWLV